MNIKAQIKRLDRKQLMALKYIIDNTLSGYGDVNLITMTLKEFEHKLKGEKKPPNRLINIIHKMSKRYKYVNEISDGLLMRERQAGLKTLAKFKELRHNYALNDNKI